MQASGVPPAGPDAARLREVGGLPRSGRCFRPVVESRAGPWRSGCGLTVLLITLLLQAGTAAWAAGPGGTSATAFPPALESYEDAHLTGLGEVITNRVRREPLNLWASLLFLSALVHTFFTHKFRHWAHVLEDRHRAGGTAKGKGLMAPRLLHFLGEVEAVFGIWCVPLILLLTWRAGWASTLDYLDNKVRYVEPVFVVVIMAIASTRPILQLAERGMRRVADLAGGGPAAWWAAILTLGPILGSLITEPAAMTISALLLARQFYVRRPGARFAYATLGLLFVNVSVGGVLTHFAAPPVLMVAGPWQWTTPFMLKEFGWIAVLGILLANSLYFLIFRREFARLAPAPAESGEGSADAAKPVPVWITLVHVGFMAWSVFNSHYPSLLVGGFLFFLAFYEVTQDDQDPLQLRSPILVGFFLAGLVVHGGLQQWWIGPVLGRLSEVPLMLGAMGLTAFNDNAAITYLATLVPGLSDSMKHAVVAGAVAGGGLTVIANAPNPAGQSILARYFVDGISPVGLFLGALLPTTVLGLCFLFLR